MPDDEKKTRGPMSEDARIVQAKRKFLALSPEARVIARTGLGAEDSNADLTPIAEMHEAVSRVLAFAAPLSPDGRRTLLALVK